MSKLFVRVCVALFGLSGLTATCVAAEDWAALAYCKKSGNIGYALRAKDKSSANHTAIASCRYAAVKREGLTKDAARACCKSIFSSNRQCYVGATSLDSKQNVFVARGNSKYQAVTVAMKKCMRKGRFCRLLVTVCGGTGTGNKETEASTLWGVGRVMPSSELR